VTAYDRYAVAAFERGAVDYVLKPVAAERLADTVKRLRSRAGTPVPSLDALIGELARRLPREAAKLEWIQASTGSTLRLIHIDDVLYLRSDAKYTRIATRDGDALVRKALRDFAAELDPRCFWQVHRGTIVNVRAIESVTTDILGRREIAVRGRPERLEVSRAFGHRFRGE
jgi:DNA-binding LytR/AlgR family response regulator